MISRSGKQILLSACLIVVLVAGLVVWPHRPVPVAIRLDLTGTAGLRVGGTIVVDGASREFSGVLPSQITAQARNFEYTVWMQEPHGQLHGKLTVSDGIYGSSSAANDFSGVRGSYTQTWFSRGGMMTTMPKEER